MYSLGKEGGLGPGDIELDGDPAPPRKGAQQPPLFGPCLLWFKWSPISTTTELLSLKCYMSRVVLVFNAIFCIGQVSKYVKMAAVVAFGSNVAGLRLEKKQ